MASLRTATVAAALCVALAGCTAADDGGQPQDEQREEIGCLLASGSGAGDAGAAEQAFAAMQQAKTAGVLAATSSQRATGAADLDTALQRFDSEGCTVVMGTGGAIGDALTRAAADHPDTSYLLIDADAQADHDNLAAISFDPTGPAFLAGYVAASQSRTGIVALFGAVPNTSTMDALRGFAAGVDHYNEERDDDVELLGWEDGGPAVFTDSTADTERAGRVAREFIDLGADVLYPVVGPAGLGAADAIEEAAAEAAETEQLSAGAETAEEEGEDHGPSEDDEGTEDEEEEFDPANVRLIWHGADGARLLPDDARARVLASVELNAALGIASVLSGWDETLAAQGDVAEPDESDSESAGDEDPAEERMLKVRLPAWTGGLANGGVRLVPPSDIALLSGGTLQAEIEVLQRQITEGEIELP